MPALPVSAIRQPTWLTSTAGPLACAAFVNESPGRYNSRCRTRLDLAPTVAAEPELLAAQAFLFDLARVAADTPDSVVTVTGVDTPAVVAYLAVLDLLAFTQLTLAPPRRPDAARSGRPDEDHLVHAVRLTHQVLGQPTLGGAARAASRTRAFGPDDEQVPIGPGLVVRRRPRNPLLAAIHFTGLHGQLGLGAQLQFRLGSPTPGYPTEWLPATWPTLRSRRSTAPLPLAHIPQVLWPGSLHLDDADELDLGSPTARAAAAVGLARYGSTRPWRVIAINLGLPGHLATACARHWRQIHRAGHWHAYLSTLDDLFTRLHDQPPPIDYERRRLKAGDVPALLGHAHDALEIAGTPSHPDSAPALAQRFWQLYTGGHPDFAPALIADHGPGPPRGILDDCLPALHRAVHDGDPDADHGPLTWVPPGLPPGPSYDNPLPQRAGPVHTTPPPPQPPRLFRPRRRRGPRDSASAASRAELESILLTLHWAEIHHEEANLANRYGIITALKAHAAPRTGRLPRLLLDWRRLDFQTLTAATPKLSAITANRGGMGPLLRHTLTRQHDPLGHPSLEAWELDR